MSITRPAEPLAKPLDDSVEVVRGDAPLLLSLPHTGTALPDEVATCLVSPSRAWADTDCWVEKLYDFAPNLGVTVVRQRLSRTVIDVNRDPSGASLYPGMITTGLCPLETFAGEPLYRDGAEPDAEEIERRRVLYFQPYHRALRSEIKRLRQLHPALIVYDAHSIRSLVPRLFPGRLPDLNLGTDDGRSCSPEWALRVERRCADSAFSHVHNGRFKGGWITRHYGRPDTGVHALQMEIAQAAYMQETEPGESPFGPYDPERAEPLRQFLMALFEDLLAGPEGVET